MSGRLARGPNFGVGNTCETTSVRIGLLLTFPQDLVDNNFLALAVGFREHSLGWAANGRLVGVTLSYKVVP